MARPVRIEFAGANYHVSSRMIGSWRDRRERLFRDDGDCQRFLQRLEQNVSEAGVRLYLFCQNGALKRRVSRLEKELEAERRQGTDADPPKLASTR